MSMELQEQEGMADQADELRAEREAEEDGGQKVVPAQASESTADPEDDGIDTQNFTELIVPAHVIRDMRASWAAFVQQMGSDVAAGEAVYNSIFEAAPSLQKLFKTPRAVQAMRFVDNLVGVVMSLDNPTALKTAVETLSFKHLNIDVTIPRSMIFRDAILELLATEVPEYVTEDAKAGWMAALNYIAGAFIFVRTKYAGRLQILSDSWAKVNKKGEEESKPPDEDETSSGLVSPSGHEERRVDLHNKAPQAKPLRNRPDHTQEATLEEGKLSPSHKGFGKRKIPTTFNEMFQFNAAVMGYASSYWMEEVLSSFDAIVVHVANSKRLQDECDLLSLTLAKFPPNPELKQFKAVMLASLRSLLPKEWNSDYEVSWTWLWENVERLIRVNLGRPIQQHRALSSFFAGLTPEEVSKFRTETYNRFFASCSAGQEYFKQSQTRLHFIADKIISMTQDIYKEPKDMLQELSALGLRHVGYGIPTDLFGPFVTACIEVVRSLPITKEAEESFRWSIGLVSRILVRTIEEGSTIVMRAINVNDAKKLRKAVSCAPRGQRALWMLNVQVGSQSISPLMWALSSGSQDAAKAIIQDLLTIRADRENYYYAIDDLFLRHPDIVHRMCIDAPLLLPTLLDQMIWRSALTNDGRRRVNYFVKHLIVDPDGSLSSSLARIIKHNDPKIICHPTVVVPCDLIWSSVASKTFLYGKSWLFFTLIIYVTSQSIVFRTEKKALDLGLDPAASDVIFTILANVFIYVFIMGRLLVYHATTTVAAYRSHDTMKVGGLVPVPNYLTTTQGLASLGLCFMLVIMLTIEPFLRCIGSPRPAGSTKLLGLIHCDESAPVERAYNVFSMLAMLLFFIQVIDLSTFSTQLSAYLIVCTKMLPEVLLFLVVLTALMLMFACAATSLDHDDPKFDDISTATVSYLRLALGLWPSEEYQLLQEDPALLSLTVLFGVISLVFLMNMLIAQLSVGYGAYWEDMMGFARLKRGGILLANVPQTSRHRWDAFVASLKMDQRLEFNEGDVGLAGGIQTTEAASEHPMAVDSIKRYGGTTCPDQQWPETKKELEGEDRLERMEGLLHKALERIAKLGKGKLNGSSMNESRLSGSSGGSFVENSAMDE